MQSSMTLGKLFGIEVGINSTWFIIFALVTFSLATGYYPDAAPELSTATYWIIGAVSALLLFVSVLIHELAHSLVARARGMEVSFIVLYLFGGVSNLEEEPPSSGTEFVVTIVGPLSSIVLGGIFLGLYEVTANQSAVLNVMLGYLAVINILLALFNLIPGYPLDGGRLLHSAIWKATNDRPKATRIASGIGMVVALIFIAGGFAIAFATPGLLNGLWLAFIGWFLLQASSVRFRQSGERVEAR